MSIDRLPITKIHAQVPTALGPLLTSGEASSLAISYLIACKAEGKSPKTLEAYSMVLGQFARFSQEEREPFSASNVRLFLISLQDRQLSPHTVHLYYRSLNTFFNWLEAEGLIAKNPMANIKPPKLPRPVVKPFSQQDIKNLLLLCSGDKFLAVRNRAMILLFLDTGLRLAEVAGIQLAGINLDNETIRVMGKGARERFVRIGKTVQRALLRYLMMRQDEHDCLWVGEKRRDMTTASCS